MKILAVAAVVIGLLAGHSAEGKKVIQVDKTWTCTQKVDLDLVRVKMTPASIGERKNEDAVHLRKGCTGRIGRLEVDQWAGDGVKVAEGVHDLTIEGGHVICHAKAPLLHQDGIQALGGLRIRFRNLRVSCGRRNSRLVNANLFIKQAGKSLLPPTEVVCEHCSFGGWAAHTVSIQTSVRSGVVDSTLCLARFPQFTVAVGEGATLARVSGNHVHQCGPGKLTLEPGPRIAKFGKPIELRGLFLGQRPGARVIAEARAQGTTRFVRVASTRSRRTGRFRLVLRPRVGETVRLRSGSIRGPEVTIRVRPRVFLRRKAGSLVAKVFAGRSYEGRVGVLQAQRHGRWVGVQRFRFGRGSKAIVRTRLKGVPLRLLVPHAPGYLPTVSRPVAP